MRDSRLTLQPSIERKPMKIALIVSGFVLLSPVLLFIFLALLTLLTEGHL
jgi:hypothetical protein